MTPLNLDPLSFPLQGSRLIEASAGTGKTFTIALLYVRLVLGHGGTQAFERPLTPPQVLVVTFTDAATQELRDRIRARLSEAAACFRGPGPGHDPVLEQLRQAYPAEQWPACAQRLQLAGEWMDEAAVSTIHGWCYRMLREHAFDSGSLFTQTLETDQRELLSEVVRDYWRRHFYGLPLAQAQAIEDCFASPQALERALVPLLSRSDAQFLLAGQPLAAPPSLAELLHEPGQWYEKVPQLEQKARELWLNHRDEIESLLHQLRPVLHGNSYRKYDQDEVFEAALGDLAAWALGGPAPSNIERFGRQGFRLKAKAQAPEHVAFTAIDAWVLERAAQVNIRPHLLMHALGEVRVRFDEQKRVRAQIGFDDLISRLDHALRGPAGPRLGQLIRQQYPVALIDEFQDTDPVQYRIFDNIYQVASNLPDRGLFMIGDPKQAIYSFRGADIYTYLQAREATAGRHYTLGTNYRSTQAMVDAVNHCFSYAEQYPRGAFRFRSEQHNPVPFTAVAAKGRDSVLQLNGQAPAALTFWQLPQAQVINKRSYLQHAAEACASAIQAWLDPAAAAPSGLWHGDGTFEPLRPADIAVLVRNREEAETLRGALARRQLASVYLSDRDSVFASDEAHDLLFILRACAQPGSDPLLRAALATQSVGLAWARLEQLNHNERYWEEQVELFRELRKLWQQQGVLPMLRRLLNQYEVPARLLQAPGGERRLTNLLHLAEWLQRSAAELDGEHALIRHLAEQIDNASEEEILRLESDADLIKVVTVHKSKGLEYPLVLLPFACLAREIDGRGGALPMFHDADLALAVELAPGDGAKAARELANDERLGEEMRLLYVALTRARFATLVCMAEQGRAGAKATDLPKAALGYLLSGGQPIEAGMLGERLQVLAAGTQALALQPAPSVTHAVHAKPEANALGEALEPLAKVSRNWWIASYSALALAEGDGRAGAAQPAEPSTAVEANLREEDPTEEPAQPGVGGILGFPRGAGPGTFLHGLLEWAGREGYGTVAGDPQRLRNAVAGRCNLRDWEAWIDPLSQWLGDYLRLRLRVPGRGEVCLAALKGYQVEMEFWFASHQVDVARLDERVRTTLGGAPRPVLAYNQLNGMFKGFIDLAFEHEGRYYVADYKSNWLGSHSDAYDGPAMRQAMLDKRYDLQLCLYLLALHRQLTARLPGYDYDQHMGGALYLFVRGLQAPGQGVYFECPPRSLIEQLDALFQGQGSEVVL
ncbi:exodeoxyribonuclease V subunit beta [Pseudomonas typographi]|uniref:exodeoxyribonuclease V subunit beta n=1 Tax=Pseudomonas typographi TaxID=2715964 RepID=UPI001685FED2|nr:exodeoxyribonuclease V subunit beta [Pseudomonas typographi]MBD1554743.1 exodeoxyribonuclease V subunit beta [Pseudomonas typographi]